MPRKDPAAVKLGRRGGKAFAAKLASMTTAEERTEHMRELGKARMAKLTKAQRSAIGKKARASRKP